MQYSRNDCIDSTDNDLPISMLHYTHSQEVVAAIDVQTKSGADLAMPGLRTEGCQ